jgi:dihydroorotase
VKQGFLPDTISTDWTEAGRAEGVIDFPNCLSKFLLLGMPLDQVIARGTINAARVFDAFKDRGTLKVGAPADVAVLELREGSFEFVDNYRNSGPAAKGSSRARSYSAASGSRRTCKQERLAPIA